MLRSSLPVVRDPGQLVMLSNPDEAGRWTGRWTGGTDGPRYWLTYEEFEQLRDHADLFSMVMASQSSLSAWQVRREDGEWEEVRGRLVSGGFFQVLGVDSAIGRLFTTTEDGTPTPVVVLSDSYWRRRFGGRPDAVGRTLTLGKTTVTIIGVAPVGFIGETSGQQPDVWLPLKLQPGLLPGDDRIHDTPPTKTMWLHVFGRLRPGVTLAQAEAQANAIFQAGLESFYGSALSGERRREFLDQRLRIQSAARGASPTRNTFSQSLGVLLVSVGVLLLIACANLANLLLARGAARRHEIALRLSLGAGRGRIIRQLVTESLLLAAFGGVAAIALADLFHVALVQMMRGSAPNFRMSFVVDPTVLAFVLTVSSAAAIVFGVLPAWQVTRGDAGDCMREQSRGAIGSFGQMRSGRLLVSLQLALCLPLLVGAGLLARTVYNLQRADLGFPSERLLLVRVDLREAGYEAARADGMLQRLSDEIRRIPGVHATSFSELGVFSGGESSDTIDVEGYVPRAPDEARESNSDHVGPGYFSTLGVSVKLGREIRASDRAGAPDVCVINEAFARRFFDGRNPIGMRITVVGDGHQQTACQVVGVTTNARTSALRGDVEPRFFKSALQAPATMESPTFLIRTSTTPGPVLAAVRKSIERANPTLPILSAATLDERMVPLTAQALTTAQLAVAFGAVALALAAIGLYGVLSFGVARRTGEIAIRIALGAQSRGVIAMILRETVGLIVAGLALGGGLAYLASRLIGSRLYGVAPQDPLTIALATGLLLLVALSAAYLPAQRASRLDPMVALRR